MSAVSESILSAEAVSSVMTRSIPSCFEESSAAAKDIAEPGSELILRGSLLFLPETASGMLSGRTLNGTPLSLLLPTADPALLTLCSSLTPLCAPGGIFARFRQ